MAKRLPLLMLTLAVAAAAQDARTAALTGVVTDPAGAVVAGAKVTVVNIATKFTSEGVTNETGRYFIPYLAPGTYELRVEAPGFSRFVRTDIQLRAGDFPRIDVQLQLGAVTESVTVSGAVPLLQTETATTTATLQNRVFMRIPVMQVRTYNILTYLPGVNNTGFNAFNAIGQRNRSMGYSVDGVSAKEPVRGPATDHTQTLQTTMDAIEEVRVLTTGLPAEFGRAGSGMIVAVMKSGTNQLHGSAEDRYINRHLLHRRYFDLLPQSPMGYHELAATLSGPVVLPGLYNGRDRTFFLLGWQRHHEKASETAVTAVPTEAMLNGDFSFNGLGYPIFDPFTTRQVNGEWVRDPFPGNRIPVSMFDPVARNFLNRNPWHRPNQPGYIEAGGPRENFVAATRYRSYRSRMDVKFDQQLSPAHKFFVRYSHNWHWVWSNRGDNIGYAWELLNPAGVPTPTDMGNLAFSDTWTLSPTTINEFRLGATRRIYTRRPESYGQGWAEKLGIPNVPPETFPQFNNLGFAVNPGGLAKSVAEEISLAENFTRVVGRHTLKTGWEVIRSRFNNVEEDRPSGIYNMGGTDYPFRPNTGNGFAAFLLGTVQSAQFTRNMATWLPRWWTHGLYIQDEYRPRPGLTLNIGLRWSYESPYKTKYGQQSQFDPQVTDPITGRQGAIVHPKGFLARRDLNNFQPRIGVAWNFRPSLVFRGSFGIMTIDLLSPATNICFEEYFASANIQQPPGDPRIAFRLSQGPPRIVFNVNPDGTVPFVGVNYAARQASWYDPAMRMPYIASWSAGVQWQVARDYLVEFVYQGSSGVKLLNFWNYNSVPLDISRDPAVLDAISRAVQLYRPYPQFGEIRHYSNYGHSSYHGGTVRLEKRYSYGITLNTFYTYSKALNDSDTELGVTGITFYNRRLEKAVAGFDLTHRWVTTFTWDLPFGSGRRFLNTGGWANRVLGGWELTWAQTLQSGLPFTVTFAGSPYRYLPGASRPNILVPFKQAVVQNWNIGPHRFPTSAQNPYLRAEAFAYPPAFTPGNLGRNTFRGPRLYWPQASLAKQWPIRERLRFTLRADVSNVFKRPQFGRPGSVYDTRNLGTFGRFTSELGNFAEIGSRFHWILVFRLQW
jgi:hypothetical protein